MPVSSAIDQSAVARVLGIKTTFRDLRGGNIVFLPQRIAVIGQGNADAVYPSDKAQHTTALSVARAYGFGSPLHLAAQQLFPVNGDGVGTVPVTFYPLQADAAAAPAVGTVTPSGAATGTASFRVSVNGIKSAAFVVASGDTVADITAKIAGAVASALSIPVAPTDNSTDVTLTSKWAGASANALRVTVEATSENTTGVTFAVTQPAGGLVDPDVTPALAAFGTVWESLVLNCFNVTNTDALDAIQTAGVGRWGATVRKPFVSFVGNTEPDVTAATAVSDGRRDDFVNSQLVAPGSPSLPLVVAARQLARIAVLANNNPAHDYAAQEATGIEPGADSVQWMFPDRDRAVKAGSSTVEVKDGVVTLSDIVTFYHPEGNELPEYRFVVDIVKLQNIIFNMSLIFETKRWAGAPLIPDDQPTVNRDAKKPKAAVAAMAVMARNLGLNAIISDPDAAERSIRAAINDMNPRRLDACITVALSGNSGQIAVDLDFGFFFGAPAVLS